MSAAKKAVGSSASRVRVADLPPVIVEWEDAALDDYDGPPEGFNSSTVVNRTVGFMLRKNRKEVVLVRDVTPAENTIRWPYGIPRRLVKRIIELVEKPEPTGGPDGPKG